MVEDKRQIPGTDNGGQRAREALKAAQRVVVKVGTSSITYENGRMNLGNINRLARALSDQMNRGKEMILVSSGAIAVGRSKLRQATPPQNMPEKQAFASIGQSALMNAYSRHFSEYGYEVGQVLLTRDDVDDQVILENITNTFEQLIRLETLPIVNENDTVSTKEVMHNGTFGDNDALSAIVAKIVRADLLILLSDIDGLFDCDPHREADACLVDRVFALTPELRQVAGGRGSRRGTGGMISKLSAARIAMEAGIDMVISNGSRPEDIAAILAGEVVGTFFDSRP